MEPRWVWFVVLAFVLWLGYFVWWEKSHPCSESDDPQACEEARQEAKLDQGGSVR